MFNIITVLGSAACTVLCGVGTFLWGKQTVDTINDMRTQHKLDAEKAVTITVEQDNK